MALDRRLERSGFDLAADPYFVPPGFEVVEHVTGPFVEWNPLKPRIELYTVPNQGKGILKGTEVQKALGAFEGIPVNANALDYFLKNLPERPGIVPEDWRTVEHHTIKHILFWGTVYRHDGDLCVRSMDWNADARVRQWAAGFCWVDNLVNLQFPAAMLRRPRSMV